MSLLLTTTGTIGTVTLKDLGNAAFVHPVVSYAMFPEWDYFELALSNSLGTALDAGYVTLNNSGITITTSTALKDIQAQPDINSSNDPALYGAIWAIQTLNNC